MKNKDEFPWDLDYEIKEDQAYQDFDEAFLYSPAPRSDADLMDEIDEEAESDYDDYYDREWHKEMERRGEF